MSGDTRRHGCQSVLELEFPTYTTAVIPRALLERVLSMEHRPVCACHSGGGVAYRHLRDVTITGFECCCIIMRMSLAMKNVQNIEWTYVTYRVLIYCFRYPLRLECSKQ